MILEENIKSNITIGDQKKLIVLFSVIFVKHSVELSTKYTI